MTFAPPATHRLRHGFTLIELLVVISIIALLISILLPALGAARDAARTIQCKSQMKQILIGTEAYLQDQKDWFPLYAWYYPHNPFPVFGKVGAIGEYLGHTRENRENISMATCPAANMQAEAALNYRPTIGMNSYIGVGYESATVDVNTGVLTPSNSNNWTVDRRLSVLRESDVMIYLDTYPSSVYTTGDQAGRWYYEPNVSQSRVSTLAYPHRNTTNLAYVDGHVGDMHRDQLTQLNDHRYTFWGATYSKSHRGKWASWALPW